MKILFFFNNYFPKIKYYFKGDKMKLVTSLAVCLLGAGSLFASSALVEKAVASGLKAIPADKTELMKLIDDKNDPITKEKVATWFKIIL